MRLYHGTSLRKWTLIQSDGYLDPAPYGDQHVSFSSDPAVAAYFAQLAWFADDFDEIGMVVLETHTGAMLRHGLTVEPFESDVWGDGGCAWEKEYSCQAPVPISILGVYSSFGPIARRKFSKVEAAQ